MPGPSRVNQLIIKALQTSSEAEAESCFRMARKHFIDNGGKIKSSSSTEVPTGSNNSWRQLYAVQRTQYNTLKQLYELEKDRNDREIRKAKADMAFELTIWRLLTVAFFTMTLFFGL